MRQEPSFISLLAGACVAVGVVAAMLRRGRAMVNRWAEQNAFLLTVAEHRWIRRGPFVWTSSKGQLVYFIEVRTPSGETKRGWLRCGSFLWGIWQEKTEVRWET